MQDLGSCAERRKGSSPLFRMKNYPGSPEVIKKQQNHRLSDEFAVLFISIPIFISTSDISV